VSAKVAAQKCAALAENFFCVRSSSASSTVILQRPFKLIDIQTGRQTNGQTDKPTCR